MTADFFLIIDRLVAISKEYIFFSKHSLLIGVFVNGDENKSKRLLKKSCVIIFNQSRVENNGLVMRRLIVAIIMDTGICESLRREVKPELYVA